MNSAFPEFIDEPSHIHVARPRRIDAGSSPMLQRCPADETQPPCGSEQPSDRAVLD
jgi:hypothetical protein